ncbi:MAG: amino acid ABC transporter permease [Parvularculales bacterium]
MSSEGSSGPSTATSAVGRKKGSISAFLNNSYYRGIIFQALTIALIVGFVWWVVGNTVTNLAERNIASGFGFLNSTAGFSINFSLIEYSEESTHGRVLLVGLLNTILCAALSIFFATIIGFVVGVGRLSSNWLVRKLSAAYVEIVRNVPLLLIILFVYIAVLQVLPSPRNSFSLFGDFFWNNRGLVTPQPVFESGSGLIFFVFIAALVMSFFVRMWARKRQMETGAQFPVFYTALGLIIGLPVITYFLAGQPISFVFPELKGFNFVGGINIVNELLALVIALSMYTASYIAEIVRAGILSVSHGQTEAAYSLGLSPGKTTRLIVIPQAMRLIIPPLTSQYLNLTKNSSLAAAIAYPELVSVFAGTSLNQVGQAVEVLSITMAIYLSLSLLTSLLMNWYNASMALKER